MASVTVKVAEGIYAVGDPVDMGVYTAAYMQAVVLSAEHMQQKIAEKELAEKVAREFKGVKIVPLPKKDGDQDGQGSDV